MKAERKRPRVPPSVYRVDPPLSPPPPPDAPPMEELLARRPPLPPYRSCRDA